jgi:cytochrome c oxidase subunit 2
MAQVAGDAQAGKPLYAVCGACHGAQGEGNPALNAPKLSGQGDWYLKRQLNYFKRGTRGAHEEDKYGKQMAPMAATLTDEKAMNDVIAFIKTLPDRPAPATLNHNAAQGRKLYETCGTCHGPAGQGMQATNAPRLKGMSDWYMVTQLKNFKRGIRGAHPKDMYGSQMISMTEMLADDQAIGELVAYINTLK